MLQFMFNYVTWNMDHNIDLNYRRKIRPEERMKTRIHFILESKVWHFDQSKTISERHSLS